MIKIIFDGPNNAQTTIALAHGAGAPMDTNFMQFFSENLSKFGYKVARFEFPYMAEQRLTGKRKPPNRIEILMETWIEVIDQLGADNLIIGGKSMGARVASLIADQTGVKGLICLGYPFHAAGKKPGQKRLEHLAAIQTPTLICQGTRDALGSITEINEYKLSNVIRVHWIEDGDHGFKPRRASGRTEGQNLQQALINIREFIREL